MIANYSVLLCNHVVSTKTQKEARLNLRIDEAVRRDFAIAARLKGATSAGLIHMFIARTITETRKENPEAFASLSEAERERPFIEVPERKAIDPEPKKTRVGEK